MKALRRNYSMSDADLIQLADDIHGSATRDLIPLEDQGVNPQILAALVVARDLFSDYPTDEVLMGAMIVATQLRDDKAMIVRKGIDNLASKARFKFGGDSGEYIRYGVGSISQEQPHELIRTGRRVLQMSNEYETVLVTEGLTSIMLDDFSGDLYNLDIQIDAQKASIKDRNAATHERIRLGNALYARVVNLAEKGKQCWKYTNEALYNDYIIHHRSTPNAQVVDGNVGEGQAVNLSVTDVESNSEFTLTNTGDSELRFFFTDNPVSTSETTFVSVPPHSIVMRTAVQMGFNEAGLYTLFNVFNPGPQPGSYDVEWS